MKKRKVKVLQRTLVPSLQPSILSQWTVNGVAMRFEDCLKARRNHRGKIIADIVRVDMDVSPK